jgi:L-histidine N-alpha-methyltransferase
VPTVPLRDQLAADVRDGLLAAAPSIPPRWFYDARGSRLFDEITRLPEYYPTRTERQILETSADAIAAACPAATLAELGAGMATKTTLLLDALQRRGTLTQYVPLDVDATTLAETAPRIAARYGIAVLPVVGDLLDVELLPRDGRRLIALLGGTIGNLLPDARAAFLARVAGALDECDAFLVGIDLVKDRTRLVAAYDDAAGVTAAFNRNVLCVINRELDADFDPSAFAHIAVWNEEQAWIEMRLRAVRDQVVRIGALAVEAPFAAGDEILTEISAKFRIDGFSAELATAGLEAAQVFTDPRRDFALVLATRPPAAPSGSGAG